VRKVQEQVEDPNQDLNLEQFNELLSQLQQARENGVQILSYQEYPGAIYTESLNAKDFSDYNTVVYGHNMKDGSMFQGLHAYEDSQYLEKHPYVYIHANRKDNEQNLCVYCI